MLYKYDLVIEGIFCKSCKAPNIEAAAKKLRVTNQVNKNASTKKHLSFFDDYQTIDIYLDDGNDR